MMAVLHSRRQELSAPEMICHQSVDRHRFSITAAFTLKAYVLTVFMQLQSLISVSVRLSPDRILRDDIIFRSNLQEL